MSAGSSLAYPGGRTLAAWWRQLASHHPQAFWVGYLPLQRVEALVLALRPHRLPAFEYLVLKALAVFDAPVPVAALTPILHLEAHLVNRVLWQLHGEGLVATNASLGAALTDAGRQTLDKGEYLRPRRERRVFHFAQIEGVADSARFVALAQADKLPWLPAPELPFDVTQLTACMHQPEAWKRAHEFPLDVREVLTADTLRSWEQVVVVTPQRLFVAVVRTPGDDGPTLTGFAVQVRTWELQAAQPAFVMPEENWPLAFSEADWRRSFVEWCSQRQTGVESPETCGLKLQGERLLVECETAASQTSKGDSWLLAGDDPLRGAARLEFV